jgi:hypothetical protein
MAVKLRDYLSQGGKLVLTGESGLDFVGGAFALKEAGLHSDGPLPWATPFIRVDEASALAPGVEPMDHVVYEPGWSVAADPGTDVLARVVPPYFDRTYAHFNSHAQTPPAVSPGAPLPADARPAATRRGDVVYVAFPLCRAYRRGGNRVYRTILANAIDALLPERQIRAALPSSGQVTLLRQPDERGRLVAHLLYYAAERRTAQLDIVEDVVTLHDVALAVRTDFTPSRVYEAPSGAALPFAVSGETVSLTLPSLTGHAMVVFEP